MQLIHPEQKNCVRKTHIITLLFVNVCHNIRLLCMSPQFKKNIKEKNSSVSIINNHIIIVKPRLSQKKQQNKICTTFYCYYTKQIFCVFMIYTINLFLLHVILYYIYNIILKTWKKNNKEILCKMQKNKTKN